MCVFARQRADAALPLLHSPSRQSTFSSYRIILDPVDRLPSEPSDPGDLADACGLPQQRLRTLVLLAAVARLAPLVRPRVPIALCVRDASPLRFLRSFCLRLGRCGHKGDQRIPDGTLHSVLRRAVERDAVDHRADDHATSHELADRVADVLVVPAKAIHPANDQCVAISEQVEQTAALGSLGELGANAGDALVPDDLIKLEASLLGLGSLVLPRDRSTGGPTETHRFREEFVADMQHYSAECWSTVSILHNVSETRHRVGEAEATI